MCHSILDSNETLQEALSATQVTKKLEKILAPLENKEEPSFILIEGASGIGKSVLLKEIAYQWGKKLLLQDSSTSLSSQEITTACSKYLFENGGKDLIFLFDGYDELPENCDLIV